MLNGSDLVTFVMFPPIVVVDLTFSLVCPMS